jgi:hypothetical protein
MLPLCSNKMQPVAMTGEASKFWLLEDEDSDSTEPNTKYGIPTGQGSVGILDPKPHEYFGLHSSFCTSHFFSGMKPFGPAH